MCLHRDSEETAKMLLQAAAQIHSRALREGEDWHLRL